MRTNTKSLAQILHWMIDRLERSIFDRSNNNTPRRVQVQNTFAQGCDVEARALRPGCVVDSYSAKHNVAPTREDHSSMLR